MNLFKPFLSLVLIFLIAFSPLTQATPVTTTFTETREEGDLITVEDIFDFIDRVENDESVEDGATEEDLEKVNKFISILALHGVPEDDDGEELLSIIYDTHDLLNQDYNSLCSNLKGQDDYVFMPAVFNGKRDIVHCKGWVSNAWKNTKKFLKKHKKAIIVGTVVVVAVAVVVYAAVAYHSAAAAASASSCDTPPEDKKRELSKPEDNDDLDEEAAYSEGDLDALDVIKDNVSAFKEEASENEEFTKGLNVEAPQKDPNFLDVAKDLGSYLAHETLEAINELTSIFPATIDELRNIAAQILPEGMIDCAYPHLYESATEIYEATIAKGHEFVDQFLSTQNAGNYTPEVKRFKSGMITYAYIPFQATPRYGHLPATQASSQWGWKVGQEINRRTWLGRVPSWGAVRFRYWKNRAHSIMNGEAQGTLTYDITKENMNRMKRGRAPLVKDPDTKKMVSMELHHNPPQRKGGLFEVAEVAPWNHAEIDPFRKTGKHK